MSNNTKTNNGLKIYHYITTAAYAVSVLICVICNLAVSHILSWANIVLISLMIAYSVTNLPLLLRKHRLAISAAAVSVLLYILLYVCSLTSGGNWLFTVAYPILTVCLIFVWLVLITLKYVPLGRAYKTAILCTLSGFFTVMLNPFVDYLLGERLDLASTLIIGSGASDHIINQIVFYCFLITAVINVTAGLISTIKSRHSYR